MDTSVVHDIFTETAARLAGQYEALSETDGNARERWGEKALRLRGTARAVPADDRAQLIAYIRLWRAELDSLKGAGR